MGNKGYYKNLPGLPKNFFLSWGSIMAGNATTGDFSVVQQKGNMQVKGNVTYYNLDVIISVGNCSEMPNS